MVLNQQTYNWIYVYIYIHISMLNGGYKPTNITGGCLVSLALANLEIQVVPMMWR